MREWSTLLFFFVTGRDVYVRSKMKKPLGFVRLQDFELCTV